MLIIEDLAIAIDVANGKLVYYSFDPKTGTVNFENFGEVSQDSSLVTKNKLIELADNIKVDK